MRSNLIKGWAHLKHLGCHSKSHPGNLEVEIATITNNCNKATKSNLFKSFVFNVHL